MVGARGFEPPTPCTPFRLAGPTKIPRNGQRTRYTWHFPQHYEPARSLQEMCVVRVKRGQTVRFGVKKCQPLGGHLTFDVLGCRMAIGDYAHRQALQRLPIAELGASAKSSGEAAPCTKPRWSLLANIGRRRPPK